MQMQQFGIGSMNPDHVDISLHQVLLQSPAEQVHVERNALLENSCGLGSSYRARLAIYANEFGKSHFPGWGPWIARDSSIKSSFGGSEEAIIETASALHRVAPWLVVEVFTDTIPQKHMGSWHEGALWLHSQSFEGRLSACNIPTVVLVTRYSSGIAASLRPLHPLASSQGTQAAIGLSCSVRNAKPGACKTYPNRLQDIALPNVRSIWLWLHDLGQGGSTGTSEFPMADSPDAKLANRLFVGSAYHLWQLYPKPDSQLSNPNSLAAIHRMPWSGILTNLVGSSLLRPFDPNPPLTFIYASNPMQGLEMLLRNWGRIRENLGPQAKLRVYYGFAPGFERWCKGVMGHRYSAWKHAMLSLLRQDGVEYIGMVPAETLANDMSHSAFWLYPSTSPETSCTVAIKALCSGSVPITLKWPLSAIPEVVGQWDLGIHPVEALRKAGAINASVLPFLASSATESLSNRRRNPTAWDAWNPSLVRSSDEAQSKFTSFLHSQGASSLLMHHEATEFIHEAGNTMTKILGHAYADAVIAAAQRAIREPDWFQAYRKDMHGQCTSTMNWDVVARKMAKLVISDTGMAASGSDEQ